MRSATGRGEPGRIGRLLGRNLAEGLHRLTALGVVGLAAELALTRHWQKWDQGLVWLFTASLAWSWWALRPRARSGQGPDAAGRRLASRLAAVAAGGGALGVVMHVKGNLSAAPLDAVYGRLWEAMPAWERLWLAVSMRVGPAPALASGALVLLGGMVWLLAKAEAEPA